LDAKEEIAIQEQQDKNLIGDDAEADNRWANAKRNTLQQA